MIVAIAIQEKSKVAKISEIFARAPYFAIADTEKKIIKFIENPFKTQQQHISKLIIQELQKHNIETIIAGNFGTQAIEYLNEQNINIIIITDYNKTLKDIIKLIYQQKKIKPMKRVAIPTREGKVDDHFGHCNYYTIYTISPKNEIMSKQELEAPQGCGCKSGVANLLASLGVTYLLAGNMGAGAVMMLQNAGINVIRGCSGNTDKIITDWINGTIVDNGQECHQHEGCEK